MNSRFLVHTDTEFLFASKTSLNSGITNSLVLGKGVCVCVCVCVCV